MLVLFPVANLMLIVVLFFICYYLYKSSSRVVEDWSWSYKLDNQAKSYPTTLIDNYPILPITSKIRPDTKITLVSITLNGDLKEEEIKKLELDLFLYHTDGKKSSEDRVYSTSLSDFDIIKSSGKFSRDQYIVILDEVIDIGTNDKFRDSKAFFIAVETKGGVSDREAEAIIHFNRN